MSDLDVFHYAGSQVRTLLIDGDPWFVAADVCHVLAHSNSRMAIAALDEDEKGVSAVDTPGGSQRMTVINEAGVYALVFRSRVTGAKDFRRWLSHEVLPTLRRTGTYSVEPTQHALPQTYAAALRELADSTEREANALALVAELEQPAAAWEGLASGAGDYTVSDAAKMLARGGVVTGPRKLYDYLRDEAGWAFRRGGRWQAMQHAINNGWVVERITGGYFDDLTGERKQGDPQIRITAKGIEKLLTLMGNRSLTTVDEVS